MKKIVLLIVVIALFCTTSTNAQTKFKRYPVKSGSIEYKWEGTVSGTEIMYWDDYGYKEVRVTNVETKIFGITNKSKETNLYLGEWLYTWKDAEQKGAKIENPFLVELKEDPNADYVKLGQEYMKSLGYEKTGTEKVLGRTCDVWEGIGKIWIWIWLSLKSEIKILINATQTATKINENSSVPASKFVLPSDIEFVLTDVEIPVDPNNTNSNNRDDDDNDEDENENVVPNLNETIKDIKGLFKN